MRGGGPPRGGGRPGGGPPRGGGGHRGGPPPRNSGSSRSSGGFNNLNRTLNNINNVSRTVNNVTRTANNVNRATNNVRRSTPSGASRGNSAGSMVGIGIVLLLVFGVVAAEALSGALLYLGIGFMVLVLVGMVLGYKYMTERARVKESQEMLNTDLGYADSTSQAVNDLASKYDD